MSAQVSYEKTIKEFSKRVVEELGESIDSILIYGSVARREAKRNSDIDVLIISDEKEVIENRVSNIRYENDLKHGTITTLVYLSPREIKYMIKVGSPFIEDVLNQGVVLYDRNKTFKGIRRKMLEASR